MQIVFVIAFHITIRLVICKLLNNMLKLVLEGTGDKMVINKKFNNVYILSYVLDLLLF